MMEDELRELSKKILFNGDNAKKDNKYSDNSRLYKIQNQLKDNKKDAIMVMGINPSESKDGKDSSRDNKYIGYVPNASDILNTKLNNQGLINIGYFKPNYELFKNVQMSWSLFKDSREMVKNISKEIDEKPYEVIINKDNNVLVFTDLIYYHHKNQKEIEKILKDTYKNKRKDLRENIKLMLSEHIKMFAPKMIVVTNAYASDLIYESLFAKGNEEFDVKEQEKIYDAIKVNGVLTIFSGMVSGKHSLDKYSYNRLKERIENVYSGNYEFTNEQYVEI